MGIKEDKTPYSSGEDFATKVLSELAENKLSLEEPLPFSFYLYVPTNAQAIACASEVQTQLQLTSEVSESVAGELLPWLCRTKVDMAADEKKLAEIGEVMIRLARQHSGSFDGWDACTFKPKFGFVFFFRLFFTLLFTLFFRVPMALLSTFRGCILPGLSIQKGFEHLQQGRPAKAEAIARKMLAKDTFPVEANHLLGHALLELKKPEAAADAFQAAIALDGTSEEAYLNLGAALDRSKRYEEAIAQYAKALELKPEYPTCYYNLASTYSCLGNREQCMIYLQYAIYLKKELWEKARKDEDFQKILSAEDFEWVGTAPAVPSA